MGKMYPNVDFNQVEIKPTMAEMIVKAALSPKSTNATKSKLNNIPNILPGVTQKQGNATASLSKGKYNLTRQEMAKRWDKLFES